MAVTDIWWFNEQLLKEIPLHRLATDERLGSWGSHCLLCRLLSTRAQNSQLWSVGLTAQNFLLSVPIGSLSAATVLPSTGNPL